jgi:hypothetical protein
MAEYLKHGTVQFAYNGDFANFVQHGKKTVTLMLNRGARIQGSFPHLEGSGPSARFMRFADIGEVEARTNELSQIVRAWCDLVGPASPAQPGRGRPRQPDSVRSLRAARAAKRAKPR